MKKMLAIILILVCMATLAAAESDLSGLSFDELVNLHKTIVAEIMSRSEWKEVIVPSGHWRIGEDIPAGVYSIRYYKDSCLVRIWGKEVEDRKSNGGLIFYDGIYRNDDIGKLELQDGWILDIDATVMMTPPALLGF